jgi:hypothetical protein
MTVDAAQPDEPYHESVSYSWTEKAFEMLERDDLHGEVVSRDGVIRSRVWGPCPRCGHRGHLLDDRQTHTAVTNLMGGQSRGPADTGEGDRQEPGLLFFSVDVSCGCGGTHTGAPDGKTGCGVSFRVELPLRQTDSSGQP